MDLRGRQGHDGHGRRWQPQDGGPEADQKPTMVSEFVKNGDDVTVKYHDLGATKHAATISVHAPAGAKKK